MIKWEHLEADSVPGGGRIELHRRGEEYVIRVDGYELMSNRQHGSEDALADLAFDALGTRSAATRVLVGGLGMGFTLARALARSRPDSEVEVAELVPAVIRWNEGVLGEVAGHPLRDPRVVLHAGDVGKRIRAGGYDAILLDVDNGPTALSHPENHWLYGRGGLNACRSGLRKRGVLTVWSVSHDDGFTRRLRSAGFRVEVMPVRSRGHKGQRHVVWVATVH